VVAGVVVLRSELYIPAVGWMEGWLTVLMAGWDVMSGRRARVFLFAVFVR